MADTGRVTQIVTEVLGTPDSGTSRVTQVVVEVLGVAINLPDQPTITIPDPDAVQAELQGSEYSHPDEPDADAVHTKTHWQVDDTSSAMASLILDVEVDHDGLPPSIPTYMVGDLSGSTQYWARVRYECELGLSLWSAVVSFTTDAEVKPTKPSISSVVAVHDSATLYGSTYADGASREHQATQWQVDLAAGDFSSPEIDLHQTSGDLETSEIIPGFTASTNYKARVRYQAEDGVWSDWSDAYSFATLAAPSDRPAKPTVTVDDYDHNSAEFSGSAYSHPSSVNHHSSQWWLTEETAGGFDITEPYRNHESTTDKESWDTASELWELEPNTQYWIALRYRDFNGNWSEWSTWATFTTDTQVEGLGSNEMILKTPRHGCVVRTDTMRFELRAVGFTADSYDIERSEDYGAIWTGVGTGLSLPYDMDVSGLDDGVGHMVRIRPKVGAAYGNWHYRHFYLDRDQALDITYFSADEETDPEAILPDFTQFGDDPANQGWGVSGGGHYLVSGQPPGAAWPRLYIPSIMVRDECLEPSQFDISIEGFVSSVPGFFPWQWLAEDSCVGVAGFVENDGDDNLYNALIARVRMHPFPCAQPDCTSMGKSDYSLVLRAHEEGGVREFASATLTGGSVYTYITGSGASPPSWQWQCIRSDYQCIRRNVHFQVRMRATTLRELANGNRDLRVQVAVIGPGIDPEMDGYWAVDTVLENTPLRCGGVGPMVTDNNNWGQTSYKFITYFTSVPHSFVCEQQEGEEEDEQCPPPAVDLTIMGDDDVTPIWGSTSSPDIEVASFSTLGTHPRPWLKVHAQGPEHEVDPIKGSSSIGGVTVEILDKRVAVADQGSGFITAGLADADGYNALIGRRAILRERPFNDDWYTVLDGVVYAVKLLDTKVTIQLQLRSARERERKVRLFTVNETCGIVPYGPVDGYGCLGPVFSTLEFCLLPPIPTFTAKYHFSWSATGEPWYGWASSSYKGEYSWETLELGTAKPLIQDDEGTYVYSDITLRWRYPGEGESDWNYIRNMPVDPNYGSGTYNFFRDTWAAAYVALTLDDPQKGFVKVHTYFFMNIPEGDPSPPDGATIEVQILARRTSERYPVYFEGPMGELLQKCYDGDFSDRDPGIQYDATAMANFIANGYQRARLVKKDVEDDLRAWVEEHIYSPVGWVPALGSDCTIYPIDTRIPDDTTSLTTLDNLEVISAVWEQDGGRAIPISSFTVIRDYMVQRADAPKIWDLTQLEVEFLQLARSSALLTTKGVSFKPETIRSLGGTDGESLSQDLMDEGPVRVAVSRNLDVTQRYAYGPEWIMVRARDTASVRALTEGSWFILDMDHIPNLLIGSRGGQILCLVVRRQKDPLLAWNLNCLAAGPGSVGLAEPTLGEITVG